MDIGTQNTLFDWRVARIREDASALRSATHLFTTDRYDTAMNKYDLKAAARDMREAAANLDKIAKSLKGPATSYPEFQQAAE